ncbi:ATP-binding protein [Caulobacter sp. DWR1-3-2b1]|uniref:ATP-binding protein n=1 Tax=Caulobacter sp. DWR1-3-2b1 TaxID=2804670 RepID=UPI003CE9E755
MTIATRPHQDETGRLSNLIVVRDTGEGMPPEVAERIFEPFFTTKEVGKGSGLGLSQVYGFTSQSGGDVSVRSSPGAGATFEIKLPPGVESAAARNNPAPINVEAVGSERILVVEDDPAVLALAVDTLKGLGYQVTAAPQRRRRVAAPEGSADLRTVVLRRHHAGRGQWSGTGPPGAQRAASSPISRCC